MEDKKAAIKELVTKMIHESVEHMIRNVDAALNSGCIDVEGWDEKNQPMLIPKSILIAILQNELSQYGAKGTSFEAKIRKESRNIRKFI